jgi:uncharacterized protein
MATNGQVLLSGGLTYTQNFDSLASVQAEGSTTMPWQDNTTLTGWYASRAHAASGGPYGPFAYTSYRVAGGENNSGWIYSFGTNGVGLIGDRAFGSISSGTPQTNAFGVRIVNDTTEAVGNITISYTGEQWRNGGNANAQPLQFSYRTDSSPITNPTPGDETGWTAFSALTLISPTTGATLAILDGNDPVNRVLLSNVLLTGVELLPGQELFLRWIDINDAGNDHGFGIDDLTINFAAVPEPSSAVLAALGLAAWAIWRRRR